MRVRSGSSTVPFRSSLPRSIDTPPGGACGTAENVTVASGAVLRNVLAARFARGHARIHNR